jgi:hypothetical protein
VSVSKRLFFDNDPADDEARRRLRELHWEHIEQFTFRIPTRRLNKRELPHEWDSLWPGSLSAAANELKIECVCVNAGMFFRTEEERDAVQARAEVIWRERSGTPLARK